jgi:hypothetical protein
MTEGKKKRGRPRRDVRIEYGGPLTQEDLDRYWATRNYGGRPKKDKDLDQELAEGWIAAKRNGMKNKQAFVKKVQGQVR